MERAKTAVHKTRQQSPAVGPRKLRLLGLLGPGLIISRTGLGGLRCLCARRSTQMANRPGTPAQGSRCLLCYDCPCDDDGSHHQFFPDQSDPGALFERRDQRCAVPVMVVMMLMAADSRIMGKFSITGPLRFLGWTATIVMAAAALGMVFTAL